MNFRSSLSTWGILTEISLNMQIKLYIIAILVILCFFVHDMKYLYILLISTQIFVVFNIVFFHIIAKFIPKYFFLY